MRSAEKATKLPALPSSALNNEPFSVKSKWLTLPSERPISPSEEIAVYLSPRVVR